MGAGSMGSIARPSMKNLTCAMGHLSQHWRLALPAYIALLISTGAQLMVPQFVQNILDAITNGVIAQQIAALPLGAQAQALTTAGWTPQQLVRYGAGATAALLWAGLLIVAFAVARGLFAFAQSYMAERSSQERRLRPAQRAVREDPAPLLQLPRPQPDRPTDDPGDRRRREGAHVHRPGSADDRAGARPAHRRAGHPALHQLPA